MKSIYYISQVEDKNYIRVFRFIDDARGEIYRGFLIGEASRVPFSQALHIENEAFMLRDPEQELSFRKTFKESVLQAVERKRDRERQILEEQAQQNTLLQRSREDEEEDTDVPVSEEKIEELQESIPQIEPPMSLPRAASASTAMSPQEKELDERFRQYFYELNRGKVRNLASHVPEKKYKEFLERMGTTRIEGASYILSSNHIWRPIILTWLEENYYLENWTVSVQLMKDILKNAQVEFTENREEILKVPIKDFLMVYQKSLKRDLKVKSSLNIKS